MGKLIAVFTICVMVYAFGNSLNPFGALGEIRAMPTANSGF